MERSNAGSRLDCLRTCFVAVALFYRYGFNQASLPTTHRITNYNEVIQRDPDYAEAYRSRGEAWQHLKEQKKADADLAVAKALETDTTPSVQL